MRYDTQSNQILRSSGLLAKELGHSFVGTAHILLALADTPGAMSMVLRSYGLDGALLREEMVLLWGRGSCVLPLRQGFSKGARQVLRIAAAEARRQGKRHIEPEHILFAILRQENCGAYQMLLLSAVEPNCPVYRGSELSGRGNAPTGAGSKGGIGYEATGTIQRGFDFKSGIYGPGDQQRPGDRHRHWHPQPKK